MMEFEEEHEGEEEEEEEEDDEEMPITPTYKSAPAGADKKPGGGGVGGGGVGVAATRYRECLKNHAVGIGGHAVDGCCEFMPAGAEGTLDALKCAACNCHRNFHRKEILHLEPTPTNQLTLFSPRPHHHPYPHHHHHHQHQTPPVYNFYPTHYNRTPTTQGPAGFLHMSGGQGQPRPLALPSPSGGGGGGSRETVGEQEVEHVMMGIGTMSTTTSSSGKKRHRTKFSQEQKDKMLELAEKVGWRIQKQDETVVQQFCDETGVKRHVLKVWMHNNKHTLGKKP